MKLGKNPASKHQSAGHEHDWQPYPVDPFLLICVMTIHKYIQYDNIKKVLTPIQSQTQLMYLSCIQVQLPRLLLPLLLQCSCMANNVNVQYNGLFLSDIIPLIQCYYHKGTRLNAMKSFFVLTTYVPALTF